MALLLCQNSPSFPGNAISLRTKHRTVRVSHRFASMSVRADFDLWRDVGGDLITPIPNNAPLQQQGVRNWPPRASWYKVDNNPRILPLHWNKSRKSLAKHKKILMDACDANHATEWQKKLIMAIAMQETEHMWGRDTSGDRIGNRDAKNVWCLNLNLDMLKQVGYHGEDLTKPEHLEQVIAYLLKWFDGKATVDDKPQRTPYVKSTLNFIRYGRTGYNKASTNESVQVGQVTIKQICREYRSAIASIITSMEAEPPQGCEPLWDKAKGTAALNDSRLDIDVPWV